MQLRSSGRDEHGPRHRTSLPERLPCPADGVGVAGRLHAEQGIGVELLVGRRMLQAHLVEIDLLRRGRHVMSVPKASLKSAKPFDYLVCVNRWPARSRFEFYPCRLRDPLPTIGIPLAEPDPDAPLALQRALEQVYVEADYMLRVLYDEPCKPPLAPEDREWATAQWRAYRRAHADLFPDANGR